METKMLGNNHYNILHCSQGKCQISIQHKTTCFMLKFMAISITSELRLSKCVQGSSVSQ